MKTKFHIIKRHLQLFFKSPDLLKYLSPKQQTCPGHGRDVHRTFADPVVIFLFIGRKLQFMRRSQMDICNAQMLDLVGIGIQQLCPYRSDVTFCRFCHHHREPVLSDNLHIVIQKQQILSLRLPGADIAHSGKIECHRHIDIAE